MIKRTNHERIYIGSTPCEEDCAQVGSDDYYERAKRECRAFINQLWRVINKEKGVTRETAPDSFALVVKSENHDYGSYYEVAARYNDNDEKAGDLAFWCENNAPTNWDEEAKKELGIL